MRTLWTHTLILLIAAGLFLHQIEAESVWFDEGWSANAASQNNLLAAANADTTNPPLYYVLIYLSAIFTGQSEFGLRWLSYALGMLTVALAGQLGYQLGGRRTAIFAALTAALSGPLLWASQEMRMYTLLAVLMGIILIAWEQLRTKPNRGCMDCAASSGTGDPLHAQYRACGRDLAQCGDAAGMVTQPQAANRPLDHWTDHCGGGVDTLLHHALPATDRRQQCSRSSNGARPQCVGRTVAGPLGSRHHNITDMAGGRNNPDSITDAPCTAP